MLSRMLVLIANREDPDLGLHCLSMPFWQATSVQNFRTFTLVIAYAKDLLNAYAGVSSGARGLNFGLSLYLHS